MIQSSSFISLMKVITAYRDREAARLTKTTVYTYCLPARPLSLLQLAGTVR